MPRRAAAAIVLALVLSACASAVHTEIGEPVVIERLYFGRNVDGAETVGEAAWKDFLQEVVTPRFPNGFAVWEAQGQFRRADGGLEHESSYVLEVVHPAGSAAGANVAAIAAEYKRRFRQEAVLHLVMPGRAEF
jgi:opacity protein-like surface antigen